MGCPGQLYLTHSPIESYKRSEAHAAICVGAAGEPAGSGDGSMLALISTQGTCTAQNPSGATHILIGYHKFVLIRATESFCFVLNHPASRIETCQALSELAEQIGKSRAINCKGIHSVVNTCACCEKQGCTQTALPYSQFADKVPCWTLTPYLQYFLK